MLSSKMKGNQIETKQESMLITDDDGLVRITSIINAHERFHVEYPHIEIPLRKATIMQICKMSGCNSEEYVLFSYRHHKNEALDYEDEDSFIQGYRNKQKPQYNNNNNKDFIRLDSDDYIQFVNPQNNKQDGNSYENNTLANSDDIDNIVLNNNNNNNGGYNKGRTNSFFEKHFAVFELIWQGLYMVLLLFGVILFCHLNFYAVIAMTYVNVYSVCGYIVNGLVFGCGIYGLKVIKVDKVQKVSETYVNKCLGGVVVGCLMMVAYVKYVMNEGVGKEYLVNQTWFIAVYLGVVGVAMICWVMNWKVCKVYEEYNFLLPLKEPLVSNNVTDYIKDNEDD